MIKRLIRKFKSLGSEDRSYRMAWDYFSSRCLRAPQQSSKIIFDLKLNEKNEGKRVCIFSHFDRRGVIDPTVLFYLSELKRNDFTIVFVSTAPANLADFVKAHSLDLSCFIDRLIIRNNEGYDFGSYYVGLAGVALEKYEQLLLANDSVFGPFKPLEQQLTTQADMVGLTDSYAESYHLQSYFLLFNLSEAMRQFLKDWFQRMIFFRNKRNIILRYEVGLSQAALARGFTLKANYPYDEILNKCVNPEIPQKYAVYAKRLAEHPFQYDPCHHFWVLLLLYWDFPFIKKIILGHRRLPRQPFIEDWASILASCFKGNLDIFIEHARRM